MKNGFPKNWQWTTCGELATHERHAIIDGPFGSKLKTEHYTEKGARVVRLGNIQPMRFAEEDKVFISMEYFKQLRAHEVRAGDLLVAALGDPLGRACRVPPDLGPSIVKADCLRFRPATSVDADYLVYWLNSPEGRVNIEALSHGIGRKRINTQDLRNVPVPLAPLPEQRRIVAKLDKVLSHAKQAREELEQIPNLVKHYKHAVLIAAFKGKLTDTWRTDRLDILESASDLIARTAPPVQPRGGREASDRVIAGVAALSVNDPRGALPRGWARVPLTRIARQETGHTPSRSHPEWWGGDIPWIGIKDANLHHGKVINETLQTTNAQGLANSSARLLSAGTVCLSRTASVGYVLMMGRDMATSQDFVTWTCSAALLPKFLMYALMAEGDEIRRFGKGSTHTTIYFPEVRAIHIALAPLEEQREIILKIEATFMRIDSILAESVRAEALLDRLEEVALTKAFRGEFSLNGPAAETRSNPR